MKSKSSWQNWVSFAVGFLFAVGLAVSGMAQPQRVIGFLNPWAWDPSLLFVMLGALVIHVVSYPLIRRKRTPLLDTNWHVPTRRDVTPRLLLGSAIFGIGWGIGGFCPGPGIVSLASGDIRTIVFVTAMLGGMFLFKSTVRFLGLPE